VRSNLDVINTICRNSLRARSGLPTTKLGKLLDGRYHVSEGQSELRSSLTYASGYDHLPPHLRAHRTLEHSKDKKSPLAMTAKGL